jgi:hypothetical protein
MTIPSGLLSPVVTNNSILINVGQSIALAKKKLSANILKTLFFFSLNDANTPCLSSLML